MLKGGDIISFTESKYHLSAVVVEFIYFGKVVESGVEALGRNPLSGRLIQSGVLMNLGFMIAVIGCAILISYFLIV